jgi:hypothetical protein
MCGDDGGAEPDPELNPGDGPRVTGTVWLLNPRTDGSWRVISARRTDLE